MLERVSVSVLVFVSVSVSVFVVACSNSGGPVTTATPVRVDGVGPIKVGMTVADAEKAAGTKITVHNNEDLQGECVIADVAGWPKDVSVMLIKGTIARFDVQQGVMKTAEGAGIGSSESGRRSDTALSERAQSAHFSAWISL